MTILHKYFTRRYIRIYLPLAVLILSASFIASAQNTPRIKFNVLNWQQLPNIPNALGLAGPVAGVHANKLILAGGANFPKGLPWIKDADGNNPPKIYHETIHFLSKSTDAKNITQHKWNTAKSKLPHPIAYGVNISHPNGVISIGGEWIDAQGNKQLSKQVLVLTINANDVLISNQLQIADKKTNAFATLPQLPVPLTAAGGALINNRIFIVGGVTPQGPTNAIYMLNLNNRNRIDQGDKTLAWIKLPPLPGPPRVLPVVTNADDKLYVFSGRLPLADQPTQLLSDAWVFDYKAYQKQKDLLVKQNKTTQVTSEKCWQQLPNININGTPRCVMAGTAHAMGINHIMVFGGASGDLLLQLEDISNQLKTTTDPQKIATLTKQRDAIHANHPGFSKDILAFHTLTKTWSIIGQMPKNMTSPVTTAAVKWGKQIIIPTGEKQPAVRTPAVWAVSLQMPTAAFGIANWIILALYMAILVYVGVYFAGKETTSDDFFLGGKRIPWWAAGISIFATMLSAITYLGIPAKSYGADWVRIMLNFGITAIVPIVIIFYLPFFRRLKVSTAYDYLEQRFNLSVRLFGAFSFILFQLARMGIVVLLPALALSAVTGIDLYLCIIGIGILSTLYTYLGGIEAVIWTDVVQTFVLVGGAIAALIIISMNLEGGFMQIINDASAHQNDLGQSKFHLINWNADLASDSIVVIILAAIFVNLAPYTSDQSVIQRYMTTPDEKQAARALWTNGILCIPASILFFLVGTALWVFFKAHPNELIPLEKADQVFPWFIAHQMPPGLAGLVIAGVFAAAMSSLDSSIHSIATSLSNDVVKRFNPQMTDKQLLNFARKAILVLGILGTTSAILMASGDVKFLWDQFMNIMGFFLGTLGGLFMLGIFTKRPTGTHALIAALASAAVLVVIQYATDINGLMYAVFAYATCMIVGILSSYIIPAKSKPIEGLTWSTVMKQQD